jgi:hypothetical protein
MTCGPARRFHLTPADVTGRAWLLVDPENNPGEETPGLLRLSPADPPGRPLRAWGYRHNPRVPGGWEPSSTAQGPHALGQALAGLLRVLGNKVAR